MSKHASLACRAATLAAVLAVLLSGREAAAQPDPFEDYDRWKDGGPEPGRAAPHEGASNDEWEGSWEGFTKGTFSFGGRTQLSYTGANNEVLEGVDESNNAFWLRLTPTLAYNPIDRLHVALSAGILSKSVSQQQGQDSNETNFFLEGAAYYHIPLGGHFSFIPGIGLGFYAGSGSRDLGVTEGGTLVFVEESTNTSGFSAALYLCLGYALTKDWQIRSGLAMNALVGSESIDSSNETLATSTAHIGLPIELYYSF
jgi:hypothetical protein